MKTKILLPFVLLASLTLAGCTGKGNTPSSSGGGDTSDTTQYGVEIANKTELQAEWTAGTNRTLSINLTPEANVLIAIQKGELTIASDNAQVVAVGSGLGLNAVGAGQATITVTYHGATDSFRATVVQPVVINYGTEAAPLTIANVLSEVAKEELAEKGYSKQPFFAKGELMGTITKSERDGVPQYAFVISDGTNHMSVSSGQIEAGKTEASYNNGDIITLRAYVRKDASKTTGYYFSYNQGGETGKEAPQIVGYEEGTGGTVVPEPAVEVKTLAEFIAGPNNKAKAFKVTADVKSVDATKYGNMVLTDGTNDLTIYGSTATATALAWNDATEYVFTNPQDFLTNDVSKVIKRGDTLEMKLIRADYNGAIQGTGVILNVTPGEAEDVPEPAVETKTIAQFKALENTKAKAYNVTAEIKEVTKTKYGNMVLKDGTEELAIYGSSATATALAWNNADAYAFTNPQDFLTNDVTKDLKAGDTVTMKLVRADYTKDGVTTIQGTGVITNVVPFVLDATDIALDTNEFELEQGASKTLVATLTPANATSEVAWAVTELNGAAEGKCEVADGVVTLAADAVVDDQYKITASIVGHSDIKAEATVTVIANEGGGGGGEQQSVTVTYQSSSYITDESSFEGGKIKFTSAAADDHITVSVNASDGNTGKIYKDNTYGYQIRLYNSGSAKIVVTAASGYVIESASAMTAGKNGTSWYGVAPVATALTVAAGGATASWQVSADSCFYSVTIVYHAA